MNLNLEGQVIFIAGSSRGIGRAIAANLFAEGALVVLTGRDPHALAIAHDELASTYQAHERVLSICGDLAMAPLIEHAFNEAVMRFGKLDHLIANLGTGSGRPGWHSEAEWQRLFQANLFSSVWLAQAAVPHLRNRPSASILFISSIVALEATAAPLPYSAAKAALTNYAKNLSRALATEGIRVNTICPGNIFFAGGSWERHLQNRPEAVESMLETEVPLRRFGIAEEIASLVAYLCS